MSQLHGDGCRHSIPVRDQPQNETGANLGLVRAIPLAIAVLLIIGVIELTAWVINPDIFSQGAAVIIGYLVGFSALPLIISTVIAGMVYFFFTSMRRTGFPFLWVSSTVLVMALLIVGHFYAPLLYENQAPTQSSGLIDQYRALVPDDDRDDYTLTIEMGDALLKKGADLYALDADFAEKYYALRRLNETPPYGP